MLMYEVKKQLYHYLRMMKKTPLWNMQTLISINSEDIASDPYISKEAKKYN